MKKINKGYKLIKESKVPLKKKIRNLLHEKDAIKQITSTVLIFNSFNFNFMYIRVIAYLLNFN